MPLKNRDLPQSKIAPNLLPPSLQFFSVAEVAIILGTSTKLVHEWIAQGLLSSFRLGPKNRLIRIRQHDLEKFVEAHIRNGAISLSEQASSSPDDASDE